MMYQRPISPKADFDVPHTSLLLLRCVACGKSSRCAEERLKRCTRCRAAVYCSRQCQKADFGARHKFICKHIAEQKEECQRGAKFMSSCRRSDGVDIDPFDPAEGFIGKFYEADQGLQTAGREYCKSRTGHVNALMDEAMSRCCGNEDIGSRSKVNWLALELALENCIDLIYLDASDYGRIRFHVTHIFLMTYRIQELYDFVKWWLTRPPYIVYSRMFDEERSIGNCSEGEDMFEDQTSLNLQEGTDYFLVLELAYAKFFVYQNVRCMQVVDEAFLQSDDISGYVGNFLGIKTEWLKADPSLFLAQCRELLSCAEESVSNTIKILALCDPRKYPNDDAGAAFHRARYWWDVSKFSWSFLVYFARNFEEERCQVPWNDEKSRLIQQQIHDLTSKNPTAKAIDHLGSVHETPQVQNLFRKINALHLLQLRDETDFCMTRVVTALRKGGEFTDANCELLFGDADRVQFSMETDRICARDSFMRMKDSPPVQMLLASVGPRALVVANGQFVEDEDDRPPEEGHFGKTLAIFALLKKAGLATEENLELCFGHAGRVDDLHDMEFDI